MYHYSLILAMLGQRAAQARSPSMLPIGGLPTGSPAGAEGNYASQAPVAPPAQPLRASVGRTGGYGR